MHARTARIRSQAVLLSAVPLAFLLALAIVAAILVAQAQGVSEVSRRGTSILGESDALGLVVANAARGVTDYATYHRANGLSDYRRWSAQFPKQARIFLAAAATEPSQRANAGRYVGLSREGMVVIARYLALVRSGNLAGARAYAETNAVRSLSVALNAAKTTFDQQERALTIARFNAFSRLLRALLAVVLVLCVAGIAATIAAVGGFGVRIVRRLEMLAENVRRLGAGQSVAAIGGSEDEISLVDRLYADITRRLRDALRQKDELLDAYEREHHVASTLQQALLPQELPEVAGLRIDAAYVPAAKSAEIGGDWYDVFALSDRLLAIGVGDVAGHDLRAATVMGAARQAIRIAARENADPASVLRCVNRTLCADEKNRMVTAFFGVLDLRDGVLRYAVAGHPPPLVVTPESDVQTLSGKGVALGINRRFDFATHEQRLGLGSALVLYTDGMVEAEHDYDKGMEALVAAVRAEAFEAGENIARRIQERAFAGVRPNDDSALLFIGITELGAARAEQRQTWHLDAKDEGAAHRVKRALLWHLGEVAAAASDFGAAEAIVGELISNVARHTPGQAEVTLECDGDGATLCVSDRGRAFNCTGDRAPDVLAECGRGLFLVRALAQRFEVVHTNGGNRVSVVLPIAMTAAATVSAA